MNYGPVQLSTWADPYAASNTAYQQAYQQPGSYPAAAYNTGGAYQPQATTMNAYQTNAYPSNAYQTQANPYQASAYPANAYQSAAPNYPAAYATGYQQQQAFPQPQQQSWQQQAAAYAQPASLPQQQFPMGSPQQPAFDPMAAALQGMGAPGGNMPGLDMFGPAAQQSLASDPLTAAPADNFTAAPEKKDANFTPDEFKNDFAQPPKEEPKKKGLLGWVGTIAKWGLGIAGVIKLFEWFGGGNKAAGDDEEGGEKLSVANLPGVHIRDNHDLPVGVVYSKESDSNGQYSYRPAFFISQDGDKTCVVDPNFAHAEEGTDLGEDGMADELMGGGTTPAELDDMKKQVRGFKANYEPPAGGSPKA